MCKVYEFPVKKDIPDEIKESLQKAAKDYVELINKSLEQIVTDDTTEAEYDELSGRILELYVEAITKAIVEYE